MIFLLKKYHSIDWKFNVIETYFFQIILQIKPQKREKLQTANHVFTRFQNAFRLTILTMFIQLSK